MKVVVIGIGLIGGSMVLDIKALHPEATILGMDANENHLQQAIDLGVVEKAGTSEDLSDADFVIVSVPVDIALTVFSIASANAEPFPLILTRLPLRYFILLSHQQNKYNMSNVVSIKKKFNKILENVALEKKGIIINTTLTGQGLFKLNYFSQIKRFFLNFFFY
jgi:hypothetical protein